MGFRFATEAEVHSETGPDAIVCRYSTAEVVGQEGGLLWREDNTDKFRDNVAKFRRKIRGNYMMLTVTDRPTFERVLRAAGRVRVAACPLTSASSSPC